MIILVIIGLLIAIGILLIKYFKSYARLRSHTAYDSAANRQMKDLKEKDSNITCDYCGARFDRKIHAVCPQCGADYSRDEEWTKRFDYDQKWVDEKADEFADQEIAGAKQEAEESLKEIRKLLIILGSIVGAILLLSLIVTVWRREDRFARDDELNQYESEDYVKDDCRFADGGVIYDQDGVQIVVTGIYSYEEKTEYSEEEWAATAWGDDEDLSYSNEVVKKIEYHLINNTDQNLQIRALCYAIDGYANPDTYEYVYELVRAGDDVTKYVKIYRTEKTAAISSMVWGGIQIRTEDSSIVGDAPDCVTLTVDSTESAAPSVSDETLVYENDYIRIYVVPKQESLSSYSKAVIYVSIENKTDYDLTVSATDGRIGPSAEKDAGKNLEVGGLDDDVLPAGCIFKDIDIYSYDDVFQDAYENHLQVNFSVECKDHPEINFSTGYIGVTD